MTDATATPADPAASSETAGSGAVVEASAPTAEALSPTDAPPAAGALPDRLSNNPNSPHYDAAILERGVGIRFKGVERTNVEEYCVSEGWVRLTVAASKDRYGNPITIKQQGVVEPYFRS